MALASFDSCTMMCSLLSDSKVGSLESDKMEKALCSVTMLFFVFYFCCIFANNYLPYICFVCAFLQPPTPAFSVLLRISSLIDCEFAARFEIDLQFIAYHSGAPTFVFFVPETSVFWYAGVWLTLVEILAMGAIILLLFLFFAIQVVPVLLFTLFPVESTFGFGS